VCTFNDDMQGTAAVVLAAAFAAAKATGSRMRDQRMVIYGAGTAGIGFADMMREVMIKEGLSEQEAASRFWTVDSRGLLTDDSSALRDFRKPYARPAAEGASWSRLGGRVTLADVVANTKPTMLIGTSPSPAHLLRASCDRFHRRWIGPSSCRCPTRHRRPRRSQKI
jgi:malate dehydrogenase (oxaloacetate-decarboxylating)